MNFIKKYKIEIIISILAALFFIPFLGNVHLFDWDEINFAECAREMIVLGDYTRVHVNYLPFFQKPPFYLWLQAGAMHLFGVNEFSSRLPNAIFGIITLVVLYRIGKKLYDKNFGMLWALVYFGTILSNFYFNFGIIDPVFNFFIFLSLYLFLKFIWKKDNFEGIELKNNKYKYLILAGLACGMAVLTKGPVAYLILSICFFVYWVIKRFRFFVNIPQFLLYTLMVTVVTLLWYGVETTLNRPEFINEFIKYNYSLFSAPSAGHSGFVGYHFVVILFGCFPASIFMFKSFVKQNHEYEYQKDFKLWMIILLVVILVLFSIVKSKIIHYSSMAYFPVTYLAALAIYKMIKEEITLPKFIKNGVLTMGILFSFILIIVPFVGMNIDKIKPYVNDKFARANMDANVNWTGFESVIGIILLIAVIVGIKYMRKHEWKKGVLLLFVGTAIATKLIFVVDAYKIEKYSQGASIEFLKGIQNEDCYITPVGYKSYAQLFYGKVKPTTNKNSHDLNWLLEGAIDKKVYFITKIQHEDRLQKFKDIKRIKEKNGFVFYERLPKQLNN